MYVSGKISVKAILEENKRDIVNLYLLEGKEDKDINYIRRIANRPIKYITREEMDTLAENKSHGGYLIEVGKRVSESFKTLPKETLSLMLVEGVSDPFNLGEVCRTLYALGFDGIITPEYEFYEHEAKLIRASAGASEKLWWMTYTDSDSLIEAIQENKITITSLYRGPKSIPLTDYQIPEKVVFCIGGALRGLSRKILDHTQDQVIIDYTAKIALSTVGTTNVLAYETYRQRKGK